MVWGLVISRKEINNSLQETRHAFLRTSRSNSANICQGKTAFGADGVEDDKARVMLDRLSPFS